MAENRQMPDKFNELQISSEYKVDGYEPHTFHFEDFLQEESKDEVVDIKTMIMDCISRNDYDTATSKISEFICTRPIDKSVELILEIIDKIIQDYRSKDTEAKQKLIKHINEIVNIVISSNNPDKVRIISDVIKDGFFDTQVNGEFVNKAFVGQVVEAAIKTYSLQHEIKDVDRLIVDLVQGAPKRVTRIINKAIEYHRQYSKDINKIKPLIFEILKLDCAKTDTFCINNVIIQIVSEYSSEKRYIDKTYY